jgi:hypothetical protein
MGENMPILPLKFTLLSYLTLRLVSSVWGVVFQLPEDEDKEVE